MRILFIIPAYKPAYSYGGTTVVVSELAEALASLGNKVTVYTTTANGHTELEVENGIATYVNGVEVFYFRRITGDHTHVSPALFRKLRKCGKEYDIIHLHSWWSLLILGAAFICRRQKLRYILSPHGMLGDYTFTNPNRLFKKVIHKVIGKKLIQSSKLHATTWLEWQECLQVNKEWKGFILPNLVTLPCKEYIHHNNSKFTIGYLARIDPKKGIEILFQSLANVPFDYRLLIAGSGEEQYVEQLKQLAVSLGMDQKIAWCGWKKGEEKFDFLSGLDLFVLTSLNENFAVTVIESLAAGTPVLISESVGVADYIKERQFGWICKTEVNSVREKLQTIIDSGDDLCRIRKTAAGIIRGDFNTNKLAKMYRAAYADILNFVL
jgi:glycosyltransferase involved in cell wall biosynthesis